MLSFHEKMDGVSPRDSSKATLDEKIDCCSAPVLIYYKFHLNLQHLRHIICNSDVGICYGQPV